MNLSTPFLTLLRREFWEHRSLWAAPLAVGAFIVLLTLFKGSVAGGPFQIHIDGERADIAARMIGPAQGVYFRVVAAILFFVQYAVAAVIVFVYLLDALNSERRDRSILFWKSLPVSDTMTVASKAVTALLIVPLLVFVVSILVSALAFVILQFRLSGTTFASMLSWHTGDWLVLQGVLLMNIVVASLWYSPIAAALLVISASVRRAALLWAVLPPMALGLIERGVLGSDYVFAFLGYRLGGFFNGVGSSAARETSAKADEAMRHVDKIYAQIDATPLLANIDLWLGVAAAIALLAIAVRLRRWRDDT